MTTNDPQPPLDSTPTPQLDAAHSSPPSTAPQSERGRQQVLATTNDQHHLDWTGPPTCSVQCTHTLTELSLHPVHKRDLVLLSGSVCHQVEETECDQDLTGIPHGCVHCNVLYTHTTQTSLIPRLNYLTPDGLGMRLYTNIQIQLLHMYKPLPPHKHVHTHTHTHTHTVNYTEWSLTHL